MDFKKYTPEEIAEFKAKDLRITKMAIIKSLIEKNSLEEVNEVTKICSVCEKYVDYIYNGIGGTKCEEKTNKDEPDWKGIASTSGLPEPNEINIKLFNKVFESTGSSPQDILIKTWGAYHSYPTSEKSVKKIIEKL